jgi:hypothetical protein
LARILLDQNVPHGLRWLLAAHEVETAVRLGWERLRNGELIAAAEKGGFDILVTGDKNLRHQQNLTDRRIAVLVLSSIRWSAVQARESAILAAVDDCTPGSFSELDLEPDTPRRKDR